MDNVTTNGFCALNEQEMMETDGGVAILPIVVILGAAALLSGCTSKPYGTNSHGVDYSKATYNLHKRTECDINPSNCPAGDECPFA